MGSATTTESLDLRSAVELQITHSPEEPNSTPVTEKQGGMQISNVAVTAEGAPAWLASEVAQPEPTIPLEHQLPVSAPIENGPNVVERSF